MRLPLGWQTDLAVLRLDDSEIEDHGDHLVVRTPDNPGYYWGNFVLALADADDAARWLAVFEEAHPGATHRSVGLATKPTDVAAWTAAGFELEYDDVLTAGSLPDTRPLPAGYTARALTSEADWQASVELNVASFPDEEEFERASVRRRRRLAESGQAAWIGAFADTGDLAAELGIVDVGDGVARYQSVLTHTQHRRRGLTGHLLGVAAGWAAERGCARTVIVADEGGDADRLYRAAGFQPADRGWRAIRRP